MRRFVMILLFLIPILMTYSQDDKEILETIINEYVTKYKQPNIDYSKGITLFVLNEPKYLNLPQYKDFVKFKEKYKHLDSLTFKDFVERNILSPQFKSLDIQGLSFVIVENDSAPNKALLYSTYSNAIFSFLEFSKIGYNKVKKQALIYYGYDSGPGVGGGIYVILENAGRKWKCKKVIPAWAT